MFNGQKKSPFRWIILAVVSSIHAGVLFIPLGMMLFMPEQPKPIAFRVKLGGTEPSHAPEIGPPTRIRPTGSSGGGAPPPPPEEPETPPEPPKNKVIPPVVDHQKIEQEKQKKLQQQREKQKKLQQQRERQKKLQQQRERKKRLEAERKKRLEAERKKRLAAERKKRLEAERKKRLAAERRKRLEAERRRRQQQEVFHDNRGDNWDPNKPFGGTNHNIAVPIGSRDRGQAIGKVDGRTPAGGASIKEEEYWKKFTEFFYERWQAPAGIFVTAETAVLIEVVWDSRGRVLSKRIIQNSPNKAVTQSVRSMLDNLDYVPTPPPGIATTVKFRLISQ